MNARGIPPAAYQVLHLLSYPRGNPSLAGGVPNHWLWGYPIPAWGNSSLAGGYPISGWGCPMWDWGTSGKGPGSSHWDTPQKGHGTSGSYGMEMGYPLTRKDMGPVEVLWDGDGVPLQVWTDRHLWKQYLPVVLRNNRLASRYGLAPPLGNPGSTTGNDHHQSLTSSIFCAWVDCGAKPPHIITPQSNWKLQIRLQYFYLHSIHNMIVNQIFLCYQLHKIRWPTFHASSSVATPSLWNPCLHSSSIASQFCITPFLMADDWWSKSIPLCMKIRWKWGKRFTFQWIRRCQFIMDMNGSHLWKKIDSRYLRGQPGTFKALNLPFVRD